MMSLPLESLVREYAEPPKAIDYACGAGHFLNELALQIKPLVMQHQPSVDLASYHRAIYGIEKEYRLSKVAKVSAFMYGQQDINICYGDGLAQQHAAFSGIQNNSFDLLVANPPYSVRGFLETLSDSERAAYSLTQTIDKLDSNNSIEAFFIERAKQLLKAGGMAAVILPSSILSNGNNTYVRTREILLRYFDIVAIAELGSGTFGKTGTNTVTLFLRRKATRPDAVDHYSERVKQWFGSDINGPQYWDQHLIDLYASHIGVPAADYKTLLQGDANGPWVPHLEPIYLNAFNASAEVKKLPTQKWFKALNETARDVEMDKRYLAYVQGIERDKLLHFVLASQQPNPVLVIRSPSDTKAQKQFLGYDWSSAKGDEGIKLVKDKHGCHQTVLYDETDRNHPAKLNRLISDNFDGKLVAVPEALDEFARMSRLVDMLDFSKVVFEKQISLMAPRVAPLHSRWPLCALHLVAEIQKGRSITQKDAVPGRFKVVAGGMNFAYFHNDFNRPAMTITVSASGASAGFVNFWREPIFASDCITVRGADDGYTTYLFHVLKARQAEIQSMASGAAQPHVYSKDLESIFVPVPDDVTRNQIVNQCEVVDAEVVAAQADFERAQHDIEQRVEAVYASAAHLREIDKISLSVQYGLSEKMNEAGIGYKIFRMNEIVQGRMFDGGSMKCADISSEEFSKYKLKRGDLLFNRTNGSVDHVGKTGLFDLDGDYCFASYLVRVVPDETQVLPDFLVKMMNSQKFRQEVIGKAVRSAGQYNINATKMRQSEVPLPSLVEQQRFVTQVQELERSIATAQATIATAPARKRAILQRYL
jgi:type I restriction-modification system DNA methylase subunit